ncbi:hypothetical protein [Paracidovorax avenae]|uniref:hypothetical protein n=1 Tax=Paracidovorax avenae TaxID=80867 RepID=UPI000D215DEA|nr:hypothetical protein [Paracidovorax avenae]AVT12829.1 hypothetical protein C8235_08015 [Paracidovorax avenae]
MRTGTWPCLVAACLAVLAANAAAQTSDCTVAAGTACYRRFEPPGAGGTLNYYASLAPGEGAEPTRALVAVHGHPRDAGKTFGAALQAVRDAGALRDTLVVAPVFQVAAGQAGRCSSPGVPPAQAGDLLWTCSSWIEGGPSANGARITSFAAMDALVAELVRRWPGLRTVTVAGFSAGGQMVQHYIGFANAALAGASSSAATVALRYVVADPGTWLYFDAWRPHPPADGTCPGVNRWKYGTDDLPAGLGRIAAQARERYAAADVHYLEGALDSSDARGTYYGILDKSCAAMAQGPYRLQRGLAYAEYEWTLLAPGRRREVVVVPGCAHDVACVFPSEAARAVLLGR